jgi:peptidyl-prolyl cis-trans isomerase A (cyclophilin A)
MKIERKRSVAFVFIAALAVAVAGAAMAQTAAPPVVIIETSMGSITVELNPEKAPKTVANFLSYVKEDFYRGLTFHRVIPGFMIQGGGFTPDMTKKPTPRPPISNEAANGLKNVRGAISMARTMVVDSATSQFFICLADKPALDHRGETPDTFGYAVFGQVTAGMEVVDKIAETGTGTKGTYQNVPLVPVVIKTIRLKGAPAAAPKPKPKPKV